MENKRRKKQPVLLPVYFKKIGLALMILAFTPAIVVKSMNVQLAQTQKELFQVFTLNAFVLGLLFVAWSRDKVEDEMTVSIRLKCMYWTVTWAALYVVIIPFIDLLFTDPIGVVSGQQVVLSMLFFYLFMYYLQKKRR